MRSTTVLLASLFILLFSSLKSFAQLPLSDQATVSLLTCGPGDELYSVFGHTAIRINDPLHGMDVVYNYGTFDFDTPNFYLKFVKGDLQYFVSTSSYEDFVYTYKYYNRDVYEQQLNLSPEEKQAIATDLNTTITSEKRFYTYKYFDRNCTTMVADVINAHLKEKISMKNSDEGKTYRKIVIEYLDNSFYENLGISLIFGYKTDRTMERLFLPQQLLEGVNNTKIANEVLSQPVVTVFKSTAVSKKSIWNNYYTYAAACLLLIIASRNNVVNSSLLAIFGLLGIFFSVVGLYSFHAEISQNYNVLLINPLFLVVLYCIFSKRQKAAVISVYICLACILCYFLFMFTKPHLVIILPLLVLVIVLLLRIITPKVVILPSGNTSIIKGGNFT
jgi:hypothetical protein